MARGDWMSSDAYEELRSLDVPGFAFEYLDRNPDFIDERGKLERAVRRGALNSAETEAFSQRWGLRFRSGGAARQQQRATMGAARAAQRDRCGVPAG